MSEDCRRVGSGGGQDVTMRLRDVEESEGLVSGSVRGVSDVAVEERLCSSHHDCVFLSRKLRQLAGECFVRRYSLQ